MPFSAEYRIRQTNSRLLRQLSELQPAGGQSGILAAPLESNEWESLLAIDSFRPGVPAARSLQDIWPWAVLLGATLFFADCFVRRVAIDLLAPLKALQKKRARQMEADKVATARLDRLRSMKVDAKETTSLGGLDLPNARVYETNQNASAEDATGGEFGKATTSPTGSKAALHRSQVWELATKTCRTRRDCSAQRKPRSKMTRKAIVKRR